MAAIANEASSSLALIAPLAAIIAETPHIEEPIANRDVSFGVSLKVLPSQVISTIEMVSSSTTAIRLMPPSLSTSPSRKRTPSSTIPSLRKNS